VPEVDAAVGIGQGGRDQDFACHGKLKTDKIEL